MNLEEIIKSARGLKKVDLLLKNARVVNVVSSEIIEDDVAISDGRICGFGDYSAKKVIDLKGKFLLPGFIDGHIHIESSMVTISEFARTVVPLGTTSVIADPHEIANVLGLDGIKYMLDSSKYQPLDVFFMLPSCVPATSMETSGAILSAGDIFPYLSEKWVVGLGEMMDFPGVLSGNKEVLDKIKLVANKKIDGHSPGLTGKDLSAYIAAGISSDHESTELEEAREKLRKGMHIMIREGTATKNLEALLPLVDCNNVASFSFVSDDRSPKDLILEGHMNYIVSKAISQGLDPMLAIKLASINTAKYFNLKNHGSIVPGAYADLQVKSSLESILPEMVFKNGNLVAENGELLPLDVEPKDIHIRGSISIKWMEVEDFQIKAGGPKVKVIELVPDQIITKKIICDTPQKDGYLVSDTERDLLKICVVDRHRASGNIGKGIIKGMGLKKGAIATSVAHDSHNIVAIGVTDDDILKACIKVVKMGGGIAIAKDDEILDSLPLPLAGLMSVLPVQEVDKKLNKLVEIAHSLGAKPDNPFFTLSFLCLPVIPELKVTDRGLVDVGKFEFVELFNEN